MNGKKAQVLRRIAETISVGKPRKEYADRRYLRVYHVLGLSGEMEPRTYEVYTRRLVPACTRAIYQRLKVAGK
jgi:hypothetical protein